jgi:hypothetical protein
VVPSYLTNRQSQVRVYRTTGISSPFEVISGLPQGSGLGPLFFRCLLTTAVIKYLRFADDIEVYRAINSPKDDTDSKRSWCTAVCIKLDIREKCYPSQGKLTYSSRSMNSVNPL